MEYTSECVIDENHPSLPGHFPGNPIVPGVVIIDEVIAVVGKWQPQAVIEGFNSVKFIQPLLPNEHFVVELNQTKSNRIKFECKKTQQVFASGLMNINSEQSG